MQSFLSRRSDKKGGGRAARKGVISARDQPHIRGTKVRPMVKDQEMTEVTGRRFTKKDSGRGRRRKQYIIDVIPCRSQTQISFRFPQVSEGRGWLSFMENARLRTL